MAKVSQKVLPAKTAREKVLEMSLDYVDAKCGDSSMLGSSYVLLCNTGVKTMQHVVIKERNDGHKTIMPYHSALAARNAFDEIEKQINAEEGDDEE